MSDEELLSTGNVQEVLPGPLCPLTNSILVKSLEKGLVRQFYGILVEDSTTFGHFFPVTRHHVFFDIWKVKYSLFNT